MGDAATVGVWPGCTRDGLGAAAAIYLGGADPRDPRASAIFGDPTGLPPVMIHVGDDEILLDDSTRFAEGMTAAGAEAELHVWEGMTHVFVQNAALAATGEALASVGAFLREHLRG